MPFSVQDFHDLVRLIEQHPEWRVELRRLVLTEELLSLPALVRELVDVQRTTERHLAELARAQARTDETLQALMRRVERVDDDLAELRSDYLERRYRERPGAYFGRIVRRAYTLSDREFGDLVDAAEDEGRLTLDEVVDLLPADLIVRGRRRDSTDEVYLLVEASLAIGAGDVERAIRRAALLQRALGPAQTVLPVVAGVQATREARSLAAAKGVWVVLNGRAVAPEEWYQPEA